MQLFKNIGSLLKFVFLINKHKDREAFFIGNGPSVRIEDLKKIQESGKIIFVFNRFYLSYKQFDMDFFKPNYIVSIDPIVIEDFGTEIISNNHGAKVLLGSKNMKLLGNHIKFFIKNKKPYKVSKFIPFERIPTGDSVVISAMNIAFYMGIKKMYLYGVDHNFSSEKKAPDGKVLGENNHFLKNYRDNKPWYFPEVESIEYAFEETDKTLRKNNGFIINCSRFTKLDVIERKELEACL